MLLESEPASAYKSSKDLLNELYDIGFLKQTLYLDEKLNTLIIDINKYHF